ncbi:MAG: hypothetical protein H6Q05_1488 [Acidobacteria bacterium]|nr:hypothetical protein [Acidobacteriota bacterium]
MRFIFQLFHIIPHAVSGSQQNKNRIPEQLPRYRNTRINPVTKILSMERGSRIFHPRCISWS